MTEFDGLPVLHAPILIGAFAGWNDAGDAATGVIEHLEKAWDARPMAALDPDDYYDFQVNRPVVSRDDDGRQHLQWPTSRFAVARPPGSDRDVVLLRGIEPNMRWRGFTTEIHALCRDLGVERVVLLGALLSDNPHTRPVPVSVTSSDAGLRTELALTPPQYEGPTGMLGVLADAADHALIPAVSVWAQVPHYASQPPSPQATLALLRALRPVIDMELPLGDLEEEAESWRGAVEQMVGEDEEIAEYVRQLERREPQDTMTEASGDQIAEEFERYLRKRGNPPT